MWWSSQVNPLRLKTRMFTAIYQFKVKPEQFDEFLQSWEELTKLIRDYEGGLGSRLHRIDDHTYLAYAQWPSRETWEQSGDKLPAEASQWRAQMRGACLDINTLHTMDVVSDLLVKH